MVCMPRGAKPFSAPYMQSALRACCSALKNFDILEETLSDGRKYLVNNEFSVADISVGYAGQTLKMLGVSGNPA